MARAKAKDKIGTHPNPIRIPLAEAAGRLSVHYETMRNLALRGVFTVSAPRGRGRGKGIFVLPDEVQIYGELGEAALEEYRIKKGRLKIVRKMQVMKVQPGRE